MRSSSVRFARRRLVGGWDASGMMLGGSDATSGKLWEPFWLKRGVNKAHFGKKVERRVPCDPVRLPMFDGESAGGLVANRDTVAAGFANDTAAAVLVGGGRALRAGVCLGLGIGAFRCPCTSDRVGGWLLPLLRDTTRCVNNERVNLKRNKSDLVAEAMSEAIDAAGCVLGAGVRLGSRKGGMRVLTLSPSHVCARRAGGVAGGARGRWVYARGGARGRRRGGLTWKRRGRYKMGSGQRSERKH